MTFGLPAKVQHITGCLKSSLGFLGLTPSAELHRKLGLGPSLSITSLPSRGSLSKQAQSDQVTGWTS